MFINFKQFDYRKEKYGELSEIFNKKIYFFMLEISAAPRVMTKMTFDKHNCCIVII